MGLPAEKHKMTLEDFLAWEAEHSFGLAGDESVNAGVPS